MVFKKTHTLKKLCHSCSSNTGTFSKRSKDDWVLMSKVDEKSKLEWDIIQNKLDTIKDRYETMVSN